MVQWVGLSDPVAGPKPRSKRFPFRTHRMPGVLNILRSAEEQTLANVGEVAVYWALMPPPFPPSCLQPKRANLVSESFYLLSTFVLLHFLDYLPRFSSLLFSWLNSSPSGFFTPILRRRRSKTSSIKTAESASQKQNCFQKAWTSVHHHRTQIAGVLS